jgi:hypothetical protein
MMTNGPDDAGVPHTPPRRVRWKSLVCFIVVGIGLFLGLAAVTAWWWQSPAPLQAPVNQLEKLVQRCEAEMLRGTCRAQSGQALSSPQDTVVFVAGVGAIDVASYRRLRDAGQALCSTVRESCVADWSSPGCRAARALHGES